MLNKLCKEAHENAVKHGWWTEEKSFGELIALCYSELSEALEDYRKHCHPTEIYYECKNTKCDFNKGECESEFPGIFEDCRAKPCGIPTELADVLIRIFDMCGKYKVDLDDVTKEPYRLMYNYNNFGEFIAQCHAYLSMADIFNNQEGKGDKKWLWIGGVVAEIKRYCLNNQIDIDQAIRIKMEYNKTRPYRHGGKKI